MHYLDRNKNPESIYLDRNKNPESKPFITNLLLPSDSIDVFSDEDDENPHNHHRNTSDIVVLRECVATPTYNECHVTLQHSLSDTDNEDYVSSFNVHSRYMEQRKRSLNLNININCSLPSIKKQHKQQSDRLVLEESVSVDNIGDLGNLSDFSDTANTNCYGPYDAKESLQFVDVEDCDEMNDSNIDLLSIGHAQMNRPYADAMRILCGDHDDDDGASYSGSIEDMSSPQCTVSTPKRVSYFRPNTFDICLVTSSPLCVCADDTMDAHSESMEYIQHSLPNRAEMDLCIRQSLVDSKCGIRYAHFNGTRSSLECITSSGGCKILQFVGYCCNPVRDSALYPELCSSIDSARDVDYILLETAAAGVGVWHTAEEVSQILPHIDVMICISPQHERMTDIFSSFGYEYIIGCESPNNDVSFASTETMAFLSHLYGGLVDKTSVAHAFDLSLLASRCRSENAYIFHGVSHERYIVFNTRHDTLYRDLSQYVQLANTNIRSDIIRPMIGRSEYIWSLIHNMMQHQIMNVTGRDLIGKSTVLKCAVRYLLQIGRFRGGCFVIDCKRFRGVSFAQCVADVMQSCGVMQLTDESICIVILNTTHWHYGSNDIAKWIDENHNQLLLNASSRIICSGRTPIHCQSIDTLAMRALNELSPTQLAQLFYHFCGHILMQNIGQKEIQMNADLQSIWNGSPGMTQKVAQFAIWLAAGQNNALSLAQIACDFNAKYVYLNELQTEYPLIDCPVHASRSLPSPITSHHSKNHVMNKSMEFESAPLIAQQIWHKSKHNITSTSQAQGTMTLHDLYPNLMECLAQSTAPHQMEQMPTLGQIECFFIKNGGVGGCISYWSFMNRFFIWFSSMCSMISELPIVPLFCSRNVCKQKIADCCAGTFIVRFASQPNGLAITYKKANGKISNVLLKRESHATYRVGKTDKRTDLFALVDSCSKFKFLYIKDDCHIAKDKIIANKRNHHHISCSLSMTQSTTQKSEDFYAQIEDNELDQIVMNFSDFTSNNLQQENEHLKEENDKLKQMLLDQNNKSSSSSSSSYSTAQDSPSTSTPIPLTSPFDIAQYVYNMNQAVFKQHQ